MTAKNMIEHRDDANMSFWRTLKEGYDAFEVTHRQPKVSVCESRYVFNKDFEGGEPADPLAACPAVVNQLEPQAMAKIEAEERKIEAAMTEAIAASTSMSAYVDGGMHPRFRALLKSEGPQKLAASISGIKYPISRPEAALADPFAGR